MTTTDLDKAIEENIVASYLLLAEHANDPELADCYRRRAATMQGKGTTNE